ncbi:MAG: hypothetical protein ACX93T_03410 [Bacteroidota bacterium]
MRKENTGISLAVISITLSLVGSGCAQKDDAMVPSALAEQYEQHVHKKDTLTSDKRAEARRRENEAWQAYSLNLDARMIKNEKQTLAVRCMLKVRDIRYNKWEKRRLAEACKSAVNCTKIKKQNASLIATECVREVTRRHRKARQAVVLSLLAKPIRSSATRRIHIQQIKIKELILHLIRSGVPEDIICEATRHTPEEVAALYAALQKSDETLLMTQMGQLLQREEMIQRFTSMNYPIYLLETDRDRAHNIIVRCSTTAAVKMIELTDPHLKYPMRKARMHTLANFLIKKQRAKAKQCMYDNMLSGNWSVGRCIDALDASFAVYEVKRLKEVFDNSDFPVEITRHIMEYDEDLCCPNISPSYNYNTENLHEISIRLRLHPNHAPQS